MSTCTQLLHDLRNSLHDKSLMALYAPDGDKKALDAARNRVAYVVESFAAQFGDAQSATVFSGPGCTEIGGSHTEMGCSLSGFDAYAVSSVIAGAGLSSSASFEVLLGNIFNRFSCGGALDAVTIAKVGQYAENVYFG